MEGQDVGAIEQPENGQYLVACVICREQKPVMLYPHRLDGFVVGWVFVCAEDQATVQGADVRIISETWPVRLGAFQLNA
jgi:hypothetical protein